MSLFHLGQNSYLGSTTYLLDSYLVHDTAENLTENATKYHLPLNYLNYLNENIFDEIVITPEETQIIRRVGENTDGTLYELENEVVEYKDGFEIPMFSGDNYFYLEHFTTDNLTLTATYEIKNQFNENYAKKAELKIAQDSITAEVSKNNRDIIARINMAILGIDEAEIPEDINKSIIEILANKISIKSDYFELTPNGTIKAVAGTIGKWTLSENGVLWGNASLDGKRYQSGLDTRNNNYVLYAGVDISDGLSHDLSEANAYITKKGLMKAKWFEGNGESGSFNINFDSGRNAMRLNATQLDFRLDNADNSLFARFERQTTGFFLFLQNAPKFGLVDNLHGRNLYTADANNGNRPNHFFTGQMWKDYDCGGTYYAVVTEQTCSCSDKRLKDNVKDSETSGLDRINKMQFRQFDWNKQSPTPDVHVDIGIIAQELKEIDQNYVGEFTRLYNGEEQKLYNINDLNLITTGLKAIQELSTENTKLKGTVDKQQKMIEFLVNKLGCKEELEEYLKGENE
jgi:hypothetical protein